MISRATCGVLLALVLAACGGGGAERSTAPASDSTSTQVGPGTLRIQGAGVTDTALSLLQAPLLVEVTRGGRPLYGMRVRFQSLPGGPTIDGMQKVMLYDPATGSFTNDVSSNTDGSGIAGVFVRLGELAGESRVLVTCTTLALTDTAQFFVLPGKAARIQLSVRDTALDAGQSYQLTASVFDRNGNQRADAITYEAGPNVTSVDDSGRITVGVTPGRGAVFVHAGSFVDTARFVVIPDLSVAFVRYTGPGSYALGTGKLDGSAESDILAVASPAYPVYSPDGSMLAYEQGVFDGPWSIHLLDGSGTPRPLVDPDSMPIAQYPHFSGDGQSVYFAGKATGDSTFSVWNVRLDGTGLTRVVSTSQPFGDVHIGVSPDGRYIAYTENGLLQTFDTTRGASSRWGNNATFLEFSPDSRRLAFMSAYGGIEIVDVAARTIVETAAGRVSSDAGLSWTPDGQWLVVRGYEGPLLIDTRTGDVAPLAIPSYYQLAVHP